MNRVNHFARSLIVLDVMFTSNNTKDKLSFIFRWTSKEYLLKILLGIKKKGLFLN